MDKIIRNYRFTDEEAQRLLDLLDMIRGDQDALHLQQKIYATLTYDPSSVSGQKTSFSPPPSPIGQQMIINNTNHTIKEIKGNTVALEE